MIFNDGLMFIEQKPHKCIASLIRLHVFFICVFMLSSFLKQFGEIEDCQIDEHALNAVITYRSRAEAEQVRGPQHTHTKDTWILV